MKTDIQTTTNARPEFFNPQACRKYNIWLFKTSDTWDKKKKLSETTWFIHVRIVETNINIFCAKVDKFVN